MSGKYVNCESKTKLSLCMNTECMCKNFIDEMISAHPEDERKVGARLTEIDCVVYAFAKGGIMKHGFSKIESLKEERIRKMAVI